MAMSLAPWAKDMDMAVKTWRYRNDSSVRASKTSAVACTAPTCSSVSTTACTSWSRPWKMVLTADDSLPRVFASSAPSALRRRSASSSLMRAWSNTYQCGLLGSCAVRGSGGCG